MLSDKSYEKPKVLCSTCLPLAGTLWVWSKFLSHWSLFCKQLHYLQQHRQFFLWKKIEPGAAWPGSKCANYCAMLPLPQKNSHLCSTFGQLIFEQIPATRSQTRALINLRGRKDSKKIKTERKKNSGKKFFLKKQNENISSQIIQVV